MFGDPCLPNHHRTIFQWFVSIHPFRLLASTLTGLSSVLSSSEVKQKMLWLVSLIFRYQLIYRSFDKCSLTSSLNCSLKYTSAVAEVDSANATAREENFIFLGADLSGGKITDYCHFWNEKEEKPHFDGKERQDSSYLTLRARTLLCCLCDDYEPNSMVPACGSAVLACFLSLLVSFST